MAQSSGPSRRTLLRGALAAAALTAGTEALSACGGSGGVSNSGKKNDQVKLPNYRAHSGIEPDLPGSANGLSPAFFAYPDSPAKVYDSPPLSGVKASAFTMTWSPIPPSKGDNPYWQEANRRIGADISLTITPGPDYQNKLATLLAGNDFPDFMQIQGQPRDYPQLMAAKFQDLSEFLSGDAVNDYPFLAALPTTCWKSTVVSGGIYGLPVPRPVTGFPLYRRDDLLARMDLDPNPKTFRELRTLFAEVRDAKRRRWAFGDPITMHDFVAACLGTPTGWRETDGKLVHAYEQEGYEEALSVMAAMVKDELLHPDGFNTNKNTKQWLNAGNTVFQNDNISAWRQWYQDNVAGDAFKVGALMPMSYDGTAEPVHQIGTGIFSITALKKADKKRIRELLALANYLAAPFGSEEYLFLKFGSAGRHHIMRDGEPELTQTGRKEQAVPLQYITDSPYTLYAPEGQDIAKDWYAFCAEFLRKPYQEPVIGLYSATGSRQGPVIDKKIQDTRIGILSGRKPASDWKGAVRDWRQGGGDKIRTEYEKELDRRRGA
ncbi:extracellular solute-binding protein [Streptomyces coelicoflavus]|uniref:extracellular solute-binding protein n=1 Tax=Streptomyces coelicoflavus TaxID=285562 RepID=UPI0036A51571